ncbi:MAG: GSCFA domain-containing protein [Myxococcota bacterium]|nr:GSCFA domain-containing protein [Myxococcota bacterium]
MQNFEYALGEDRTPRTTHPSWYRGEHCNFVPSRKNLEEDTAIEEYILAGWLPEEPFISRSQIVTSFGSCFAEHISRYLRDHGYTTGLSLVNKEVHADFANSHVVRFGEGIVNTFSLRQQFEWAYGDARFAEKLWHGSDGEIAAYDERVRRSTRELFESTNVFILTLGLSEVWYSRESGDVFWRAIPRDQFDPARHGFRVSDCEENVENLERILALVREHRPEARVILTLSPVPLVATFRPVSCLTANSVSKSILRAAIDTVMRRHEGDDRLFYWPSYEIVKDYFRDPYEDDNRHVRPELAEQIMRLFARFYLTECFSDEELEARRRASIDALAAIEGVDRPLAEELHAGGWWTAREIAQTPPEVLARLWRVSDPEAGRRLALRARAAADGEPTIS